MKHVIVSAYHSFKDPIIYGLLYKYLRTYQSKFPDEVVFHLITSEQKNYAVPILERKELIENLSEMAIEWYPIPYHSGGRFLLFKKVWDFVLVFSKVLFLRLKYKTPYIIGFTSISCVIANQISQLLKMKAICFNMEPHSEYMVDFGTWRKSSLKYKILRKLEHKAISESYAMAVPTRNAKRDYQFLRREELEFVPASIELDDFKVKSEDRIRLREKFGFKTNDFLITYVGKFDGIYFSIDEMAKFFKRLIELNEQTKYFIITPDNISDVREAFEKNCISYEGVIVGKIPYEQLSSYLSAADAGLLILPEYPSQRYRCPIKTANYLACGVPIIVNKIVGDDPFVVNEKKVGWVVDLDNPSLDFRNVPDSKRCVETVEEERDIALVTSFLHNSMKIDF